MILQNCHPIAALNCKARFRQCDPFQGVQQAADDAVYGGQRADRGVHPGEGRGRRLHHQPGAERGGGGGGGHRRAQPGAPVVLAAVPQAALPAETHRGDLHHLHGRGHIHGEAPGDLPPIVAKAQGEVLLAFGPIFAIDLLQCSKQ